MGTCALSRSEIGTHYMRPPLGQMVLMCCLLTGCQGAESRSITRQALVGDYGYKSVDTSVDKATDHQLDRLTLKADGTYKLVQGGSTKARSEKNGSWSIEPGDPPNVLLDHAGYPIQVKKGEVRLLINDDLGEWYVKAK